MASKVAEAYMLIRASLDQFSADLNKARDLAGEGGDEAGRGMRDKMKKHGEGMGKDAKESFGTIVAHAKSAAAMIGLTLGGGAFVKAASDAEMANVRMRATLQATGNAAGWSAEQLREMGKELKLTGTYGTTATIDAMQAMLRYRDVQGETFKKGMEAAAGLAAVTGGDLRKAAEEVGAALQEPEQGMARLQALGVLFTVTERRMMQQMMQTNQVLRAQQMILEKMGKAGMKEWSQSVAGTFTGALMQMKAALVDLGSVIGSLILPVVQPIIRGVQYIANILLEAEQKWKDWSYRIGEAFRQIGEALAPAAAAISGTLGKALVAIGDAVVYVVEVVRDFIKSNAEMINNLIMALGIFVAFKIVLFAISSSVRLLVMGFWLFMSELSAIVFKLGESAEAWQEWWHLIMDIINGIVAGFKWAWDTIMGGSGETTTTIVEFFKWCWHKVVETVTWALELISSLVNDFTLNMMIAWQTIKLGALVLWDGITNGFWMVIGTATGTAYALGGIFSDLWQNIRASFDLMVNGIRAGLSAIWAGATAIFSGKNPVTAFREKFDEEFRKLDSRSAKFKSIGEGAATAFSNGFKAATKDVEFGFSDQTERAGNELKELLRQRQEGIEKRRRAHGEHGEHGEHGDGKDGMPTPGGVAGRQIKIEFTGLTELWRKMQESITGGTMLALTKATADAAGKTAAGVGESNKFLDRIEKHLRGGEKAAVAG